MISSKRPRASLGGIPRSEALKDDVVESGELGVEPDA